MAGSWNPEAESDFAAGVLPPTWGEASVQLVGCEMPALTGRQRLSAAATFRRCGRRQEVKRAGLPGASNRLIRLADLALELPSWNPVLAAQGRLTPLDACGIGGIRRRGRPGQRRMRWRRGSAVERDPGEIGQIEARIICEGPRGVGPESGYRSGK